MELPSLTIEQTDAVEELSFVNALSKIQYFVRYVGQQNYWIVRNVTINRMKYHAMQIQNL